MVDLFMNIRGLSVVAILTISIISVAIVLAGLVTYWVTQESGSDSGEIANGSSNTGGHSGTLTRECNDGIDNDNDGFIDLTDFGCTRSSDSSELNDGNTQCSDGVDNDADGFIDQKDSGCTGYFDNTESGAGGGSTGGGGGGNNNANTGTPDFYITINEPDDGDVFGYRNDIGLNVSVTDDEDKKDRCWYTLNGGITNRSISNCKNTTFDVSEDGEHRIKVYVNGSDGDEDDDSAVFYVNTGAPSIELVEPADFANLSEGNIDFKYKPTDADLDSCQLWGDFNGTYSRNKTDLNPGNNVINSFSVGLTGGIYKWSILCSDDEGNEHIESNRTLNISSPPQAPQGVFDTSINSSKSSCIAPCGVHFDAIGNLEWNGEIDSYDFSWDFDFDGQEDFKGYLAAHVFDYRAEPYPVILSVSDIDGNTERFIKTIYVDDPDVYYSNIGPGQTSCIAKNNLDWEGCPQGAQQTVTNDLNSVISSLSDNTRLLLRRGDSWDVTTKTLGGLKNVQIADFGTGTNRPIIRTNGQTMFKIENSEDISIYNLHLSGTSYGNTQDTHHAIGANQGTESKDILIENVLIEQFSEGIFPQNGGNIQGFLLKDVVIQDIYSYGLFPKTQDSFALIDSTIRRTNLGDQQHAFRTCIGNKGIIKNVVFSENHRTNFHLRGTSNDETNYWLVSGNYFDGAVNGVGTEFHITGCVEPDVGNVNNAIIEKNIIKDQYISNSIGDGVLIRNNLILNQRGAVVGGASGKTKIYNNVQYSSSSAGQYFVGVWRGVLGPNVEAINNIYSAEDLYNLNGLAQPPNVVATNLPADQVNFVNANDPENGGLALEPGSAGIDEGTDLGRVLKSFDGVSRRENSPWDVGAYEFEAALSPEKPARISKNVLGVLIILLIVVIIVLIVLLKVVRRRKRRK